MAVAENDAVRLLREKSLLLLNRERELFEMRQGKSRAAAWLRAVLNLSRESNPYTTQEDFCRRWIAAVIQDLHFQVAGWLAFSPGAQHLRPIVWQTPSGKINEAKTMSLEVAELLASHGYGFCTRPTTDVVETFSIILGLEKFYWFVTPPASGENILMVAGFILKTGANRSLDKEDVEYFRLMGEHSVILMQSARFFAELQQKQDSLLDLTRNLEVRIAERTQELEKANASLSESLRRQVEMQDQLIQTAKIAAIGQLAAGIAHEINNPLAVILGFAQGLERRIQDEKLRMPIESVVREALRCSALVQELLTFSRKPKGHAEVADLNHLLRSAAIMLETKAKIHNIQIILELAEGLSPLMVNKTQVEQVFVNLGTNAIDAMKEGGRLTLRTFQGEDHMIQVEVIDTGCGIPAEIRSRIFEPFFTTKEVGQGTGLGLSLAHEIISQHGGTIDLDSEIGKGTCMRLRFPVSAEQSGSIGTMSKIERPKYEE